MVLIGDFNISLTKQDCLPRLRTEYPHSLARKEFNEKFIPGLKVVDILGRCMETGKVLAGLPRESLKDKIVRG